MRIQWTYLMPIVMLVGSNVFMTTAWYIPHQRFHGEQ